MKPSKISALLLAAAIAVITLVSLVGCGGKGSPADTNAPSGGAAGNETAAPETGLAAEFTPEIKAELGLDGYEFVAYIRSEDWGAKDIYTEEQNGEALNDATYLRNQYLTDTYGFTVKAVESGSTYMPDFTNIVMAGESVYDVAFPMGREAGTFCQKGLLCDLGPLPYFDFNADCWNRMFNDTLAILGRRYYAAGDISTNLFSAVRAIMFNKSLVQKYQLDDPYATVKDGKWTLTVFDTMSHAVSADLNGDSTMDLNDQWGMVWQSTISGIVFYYGAGEVLTPIDDTGTPYLRFGTDRSIEVFDWIQSMMKSTEVYRLGTVEEGLNVFHGGRSLFYTEVMDKLTFLRDSETDLGVLPLPKWNEDQESYIQFMDSWCISPVVIPISASSPERSAFFAQALAEASREYVRPAYYDVCLTGKYIRDNESEEMLDIIFGNCVLDNCDLYQWASLWFSIVDAFATSDGAASIAAKFSSKVEGEMQKTIDAVQSQAQG